MLFLLDSQTIMWASIASITVIGIVVLLIIFSRPPKDYPIEVVNDHDGKSLFKVFVKGATFHVIDYTKKYKNENVTLEFKSYQDVEVYIKRRLNGWQDDSV